MSQELNLLCKKKPKSPPLRASHYLLYLGQKKAKGWFLPPFHICLPLTLFTRGLVYKLEAFGPTQAYTNCITSPQAKNVMGSCGNFLVHCLVHHLQSFTVLLLCIHKFFCILFSSSLLFSSSIASFCFNTHLATTQPH